MLEVMEEVEFEIFVLGLFGYLYYYNIREGKVYKTKEGLKKGTGSVLSDSLATDFWNDSLCVYENWPLGKSESGTEFFAGRS